MVRGKKTNSPVPLSRRSELRVLANVKIPKRQVVVFSY